MPDQTSASRSSMKHLESGRHHDAPERSASRAVGVAIVAGGLAFSVSLYPLPGESPTLKLTPPKHELSESPKTVDLEFVNSKLPDFSKLELPDLAKLAGLVSHTFPDLPVDGLLGLVKTYGLPDLVKSFELLQSVAPMMSFEPSSHSVLSLSGGGGGGGGGLPPAVPTDVLPAWVTLLAVPDAQSAGFRGAPIGGNHHECGAVACLLGALPQARSPGHKFSRFPKLQFQRLLHLQFPRLLKLDLVSTPTATAVSAPTEAPVSTPTAITASEHAEPVHPTQDPPNTGVHEPDPPKSDAQSPEGGSGGGSSGGSAGVPQADPDAAGLRHESLSHRRSRVYRIDSGRPSSGRRPPGGRNRQPQHGRCSQPRARARLQRIELAPVYLRAGRHSGAGTSRHRRGRQPRRHLPSCRAGRSSGLRCPILNSTLAAMCWEQSIFAKQAGERAFEGSSMPPPASRYGAPTCLPVDESTQVDPLSPYAAAKLAGEMYLRAYAEMYGLAPICLALANVYGPRQNPHGAAGVIAVLGSAMITGRALHRVRGRHCRPRLRLRRRRRRCFCARRLRSYRDNRHLQHRHRTADHRHRGTPSDFCRPRCRRRPATSRPTRVNCTPSHWMPPKPRRNSDGNPPSTWPRASSGRSGGCAPLWNPSSSPAASSSMRDLEDWRFA